MAEAALAERPEEIASPQSAIDLRRDYIESGVGEILDELDRELTGLWPVKQRIREMAILLLVERARKISDSSMRRRRCT